MAVVARAWPYANDVKVFHDEAAEESVAHVAGAGMADVTEAAAAAVQGDRSRSGGRARRGMWRALGDLWIPLDRAWTVYALFLVVFLVRRH